MSTDSTTMLNEVRRIVNDSGAGYRVSDDDLNRVITSSDPRSECERLVRNKGGQSYQYQPTIDRVVRAIQSRTPQNARLDTDTETASTRLEFNHTSVVDAFMTVDDAEEFWSLLKARLEEVCDTLRTGASRMGAQRDKVEALLDEAGLIVHEPEPKDDTREAIMRRIDKQIKKAKKASKRAKQLGRDL